VSCQWDTVRENVGWTITYKLQKPAGRFNPAEYAAYCAALEQASEALAPKLTLEQVAP